MLREAYGEVEVEVDVTDVVLAGAAAVSLVGGGVLGRGLYGSRHVLHHGGFRLLGDRAMSLGIDASAEELPLDVRVPVVLDLVVGPSR